MSQRLTKEEKEYQKRQAAVGLASNILGISAATGALATATKNRAFKSPVSENAGPVTSYIARRINISPKNTRRLILAGAGGAVGLQAANLGGDLVTNRVLTREVNKNDQSMISKSEGYVSRNGHGKSLVEKADRSERSKGYKTGEKRARQRQIAGAIAATSPVTGAFGPIATGVYASNQAKKGKKLDAGARVSLRSIGEGTAAGIPGSALTVAGMAKKNPALMTAGVPLTMVGLAGGSAHGASAAMRNAQKRGDIEKAYRRFDPEADRQRRLGMYGGIGVGGAIVAGREAARNFETKVKTGGTKESPVMSRGIFAKPGKGKKGLGLAAIAAASGAAGVGSYKRGLSQRNQPWT